MRTNLNGRTALALFFIAVTASAQELISYQGRILQNGMLLNGPINLSLRIYNVASGGTPLYEDSNTVVVSDGLYSTFLGDDTTAGTLVSVATNPALWLETAVDNVALSPRERMGSSMFALNARMLDGQDAESLAGIRTQGIWRVSGGTRIFFGQDLALAYSSCQAGDTLHLDPGVYPLASTLVLDRSVNLSGSGRGCFDYTQNKWLPASGSIVAGSLAVGPGATNCSFRKLGIAPSGIGDGLVFGNTTQGQRMNLLIEDVAFYGTGSNAHNCEITGQYISCHDIHSFNSGAHGFVIKGGSHITLHGYHSYGDALNGFLIKASAIKGDVDHVTATDLMIDGAGRPNANGIGIEAYDEGTTVSNVVIRSATIRATAAYSIVLSGQSANRKVTDTTFTDVIVKDRPIVFLGPALGLSNVVFAHCVGRPTLVEPGSYAGSSTMRFVQCVDGESSYDGDSLVARKTLSAFVEYVSSGLLSNQIRLAYASSGQLYVVAASPNAWSLGVMAAGDPVSIQGSSSDGVYKLASWGQATTPGQPVPGTQTGDVWLALSTPSQPSGPLPCGDVLPGKTLARLAIQDNGYNAAVLTGSVGSRVLFGSQGGETRFRAGLYTTTSPLSTQVGSQTNDVSFALYIPLYLRAFTTSNEVHVGAFGAGSTTPSWTPTSFHRVTADFEYSGPRCTFERCTRPPW